MITRFEDRNLQNEISEYLSTFLTEERLERIHHVLSNRTRYLTVVVEDLYQTQNISAVMRSCECMGIQDVHVVEGENEFNIHKAISMGSDKWLSIHHYPKAEGNMRHCIQQLQQKGYRVAATLPGNDSVYMEELPLDKPIAFLFGTELTGLSQEAIVHADCSVKIPMYGFTTSLNISNSVAIIADYFTEKLRKTSINWQLSEEERDYLLCEWVQKSVKNPELLIKNFLEKKSCR